MKKSMSLLVLMFILVASFNLAGCKKSSSYTEEEHIKRISKIIEKDYLDEGVTYEIRTLYDHNDNLAYFVVDFSNDTYFYIKLEEKDFSFLWGHSMYVKDTLGKVSNSSPWRKVKCVERDGEIIEEYEKDELGNDIYYYNSHFKVANIDKDTRCYLIKLFHTQRFVPAIKQGDNFLNLITMEEFSYYSKDYFPASNISFFSSADFNL